MVETRSKQQPSTAQLNPQQPTQAPRRGRPRGRSLSLHRSPSRRLERRDISPITLGWSRQPSSLNMSAIGHGQDELSKSTFTSKRKCVNFDGQNPKLHVHSWINAFEVIFYDKLDTEKKYIIVQYLDGDALTWYSNHIIPKLGKLSYADIKSSFINRFKHQEVRPIIAAQELQLTRAHTIQSYYEEKMRLLQETSLSEIDMVAILNRGMPYSYKPHLIASKIDTVSEWLSVALELEASFKTSKFSAPSSLKLKSFAAAAAYQNDGSNRSSSFEQKRPSNKKPSSPCRFCENRGEKKFHWHSDCHHNPKNKSTLASSKPKEAKEETSQCLNSGN